MSGTVNATYGYRVSGYNGYLLDDVLASASDRYGIHMSDGIIRMYTSGVFRGSALALRVATGSNTLIDNLYMSHAGNVVPTPTPTDLYKSNLCT